MYRIKLCDITSRDVTRHIVSNHHYHFHPGSTNIVTAMNHQRVVKAVVLPLPIDESSSSSRTSHYPLPADYVAELDRRHAALEFHEEVLDDRPLSPNSTEARKSRIEALRIAVIEAVALAKHNTSDGNWAFVTELLRTNAGKSKRGLWMDIGQEYIPTDVTTPTPTPGLTKQTLVMAQKMDILTKVSNWREGVEPLVEEEPVKQRKFKQAVNTKEKEKEREVRKKTAERRLDPSPLGFSVTRPRKAAEGKGKARQVDLEDILEVAGTSPTKPSSYSSSPKELKRIEDLSDAVSGADSYIGSPGTNMYTVPSPFIPSACPNVHPETKCQSTSSCTSNSCQLITSSSHIGSVGRRGGGGGGTTLQDVC